MTSNGDADDDHCCGDVVVARLGSPGGSRTQVPSLAAPDWLQAPLPWLFVVRVASVAVVGIWLVVNGDAPVDNPVGGPLL